MLDVKTPLSKIHRASRHVDQDTFAAVPGSWAYYDGSADELKNIATDSTNQDQPPVLKIIMGNASTNIYESHDIEVGSISTLEGILRASVDSEGFQVYMGGVSATTAVDYAQGDELTVAYLITSATATTGASFSKPEDIGKLRPVATNGETVVARVESYDSTAGVLTFETVSPYPTQSL